jgi:hypothetical protein
MFLSIFCQATSAGCWPLAASYALIIKSNLVGKAQCAPADVACTGATADASLAVCTGKSRALQLASWLFDGAEITQSMRALGVVCGAATPNPCRKRLLSFLSF